MTGGSKWSTRLREAVARASGGQDPWRGERPHEGWHSFDSTPWRHPWLRTNNLSEMQAYSQSVLDWVSESAAPHRTRAFRFAMVGNIANNMYMSARPLRRIFGTEMDVFGHPDDRYIMSQPGWEEYDGELPDGVTTIDAFRDGGNLLPSVSGYPEVGSPAIPITAPRRYLSRQDARRFSGYGNLIPTLDRLQDYDSCFAAHVPYMAWLAKRPYFVTQTGADIWFEASRGDTHGWLQRTAFRDAALFIARNPWSFAHARRLGLRNVVYFPFVMDEDMYSPGVPAFRREWQERVGGDFFVFSSGRLDRRVKGSDIALDGFAAFARRHPSARLVVVSWGSECGPLIAALKERGIAENLLVLPVAGKQRVISYLRSADCLLDQFALGMYGATALEGLACGLPVVMRLEDHLYNALLPSGAPPVLNCDTPEVVAAHLERLKTLPDYRYSVAQRGREWFVGANSARVWGSAFVDLLICTALGRRFDFSNSPLARPLLPEEREYLENELKSAPRFPLYRHPLET